MNNIDNNCGTHRFWSPRKDHIQQVLVQDDGKIVAVGTAGTVTTGSGGDYQCTVTRFASDKNFDNLDNSFSNDGIVRPNFENSKDDWCKGGAIDADGNIVIMDGPIGTIGNDPGRICCKAMTAQCLACAAGVYPYEYCQEYPQTEGCKREPDSMDGNIGIIMEETIHSENYQTPKQHSHQNTHVCAQYENPR